MLKWLIFVGLLIIPEVVDASLQRSSARRVGGEESARSVRSSSSIRTVTQQPVQTSASASAPVPATETEVVSAGPVINSANCEHHYSICMNKVCADDSIGKCLCYEDKYTNNNSTNFANMNGNRVKFGFDLFEYARKQCVYILDKCMEERRSITEKYKTFVQRDCLKVSEVEVAKQQGLGGELTELRDCMRDGCTAYAFGEEDFNFPEFGLCFDPVYSKFKLDASCSHIIGKSKTPASLQEMLLTQMTALREKSCEYMNGEMASDRSKCYLNVSYGINKHTISSSKKIAVGNFFVCRAAEFNVKIGMTEEYERGKMMEGLSLAASTVRTAGRITSMVMGGTLVAGIIGGGIDLTSAIANIAIDAKAMADEKVTAEAGIKKLTSNISGVALSAISLAGQIGDMSKTSGMGEVIIKNQSKTGIKEKTKDAKDKPKEIKTSVKRKAKDIRNTAKKKPINAKVAAKKKKKKTGEIKDIIKEVKPKSKASNMLRVIADGVDLAGEITNIAMNVHKDNLEMDKLDEGISTYADIDRDQGVGVVNKTIKARGNCFVGGEWLATENETILLQWNL